MSSRCLRKDMDKAGEIERGSGHSRTVNILALSADMSSQVHLGSSVLCPCHVVIAVPFKANIRSMNMAQRSRHHRLNDRDRGQSTEASRVSHMSSKQHPQQVPDRSSMLDAGTHHQHHLRLTDGYAVWWCGACHSDAQSKRQNAPMREGPAYQRRWSMVNPAMDSCSHQKRGGI